MRKLQTAAMPTETYDRRNPSYAIPDYEDVPDPEERDHPTPLEEGDPTIHRPTIPDRGFPGEDERVLEDLLAV